MREFGLANSSSQWFTIPNLPASARYSRVCGFSHSTLVTVPASVTVSVNTLAQPPVAVARLQPSPASKDK